MNTTLEAPPVQPDLSVVKLNVTDQAIADLKEKYLHLTISGLEDKEGYKAVYAARQVVKKTRTGVIDFAKGLREDALAWQKKVVGEEKRVVAELAIIENHLQAQEDEYNRLKAERDAEIERKEKERVQLRIDALAAYGYAVDYVLISSCSDEAFTATLDNAKAEHAKEQERIAEEKRLAEIEQQRIKDERKELADLRKKQEDQERLIRQQQEEIENQKREADRIEQARLDKIAAEEKAAIKARNDARSHQVIEIGMHFNRQSSSYVFEDNTVFLSTIETVVDAEWDEIFSELITEVAHSKKLLEEARQQELEKAKQVAAANALKLKQAEDERKAAAEADRIAQLSDSEKYGEIFNRISHLGFPEMKSQKGKKVIIHLEGLKNQMLDFLKPIIK